MVGMSTTFVPVLSHRILLQGELPLANVQRRGPAVQNALPLWLEHRGEFDMLEPVGESESALWSRFGSWDL